MSFWQSQLGDVTGDPQFAYTKSINSRIPDNTLALARVESAINDTFMGEKLIKIEWVIIEGEFKDRIIFQKLKVFDSKPSTKHTALNMLKLLFTMFNVKPLNLDTPPTDQDLSQMLNKIAGIKIQEWFWPQGDGTVKSGNNISEVHSSVNFASVTGKAKDVPLVPSKAYNKQAEQVLNGLDDDVPF